MRNRLRFVSKQEQDIAFTRIFLWGYPENLEDFTNVTMLSVGNIGYIWFEWMSENEVLLHMAADPDTRGAFLTKRTLNAVKVAVELMGADVVWVITENETINDYACRQGFMQSDIGKYWRVK